MHFETAAIHVGQPPDPHSGAVIPPLSLSTTFAQRAPGEPIAHYDYSRSSNPTRESLEQCVAALEAGTDAVAFASGLAATTTLIHLLQAGDHVVCIDDVYGGTQRYFRQVAVRFGVTFSFIDFAGDSYARELQRHPNTRMAWLETPTNPTLRVTDIASVAAATPSGVILVVDNTFLSPYCQRPLTLGAHISFNSMSKYMNGHSDVIMGVAATRDDALARRLRYLQNALGGVPSPFDCYLALRGLKTLAVRMQRHCDNALVLARWLERCAQEDDGRSGIRRVLYPGLPSHPQHHLALRNAVAPDRMGGMIAFYAADALHAITRLRYITLAESLGGVESLIEVPARMTHLSVSAEERQRLGIDDELVRFSVGIEHVDDLQEDVAGAFGLPLWERKPGKGNEESVG